MEYVALWFGSLRRLHHECLYEGAAGVSLAGAPGPTKREMSTIVHSHYDGGPPPLCQPPNRGARVSEKVRMPRVAVKRRLRAARGRQRGGWPGEPAGSGGAEGRPLGFFVIRLIHSPQTKNWGSEMPRFWPAEISLYGGEERFLVRTKPRDFRHHAWLSWIPYRTGDLFIADVEVSGISVSGARSLSILCDLREPDGQRYEEFATTAPTLPFTKSTNTRYLAIKGEYVLDVTLVSIESDVMSQTGNRRVVTLEAVAQDVIVANYAVALVALVVGVMALVVAWVK